MPEPASKQQINRSMRRWRDLLTNDDGSTFKLGDSPQRTELVQGLRDLADFLEQRPDVPVSGAPWARVECYATGTPEERRDQVNHVTGITGARLEDRTRDGGHMVAILEFGPVTYEMVGVNARLPGDLLSLGQEVRLITGARDHAEKIRQAQAGYITGCCEDPVTGKASYEVHFPGTAGTQEDWDAIMLSAVDFEYLRLPSRRAVMSLQDGESLLIGMSAELRAAKIRRQEPSETAAKDHEVLAAYVADFCGLKTGELLEQIEPQVSERLSRDFALKDPAQRTGAALAASDRPPDAPVAGTAPEAGPDHPAPKTPAAPKTRGKRR